jgi:phospholipid transport system substrate-binding protein
MPGAWTIIAIVAIALGAIGFEVSISVAANDPLAEVRATFDETGPVFSNTNIRSSEQQQRLRAIAEHHFDFAYMARFAMGTHWKSLTPVQRKEFVPLFTDHVVSTYMTRLEQGTVEAASHALKDKVGYDGADRATVYSVVKLPMLADPLAVNYLLRKDEGRWKLYDIVVDNISTLANFRDEFNKIMNNGGYARLVSDLRGEHASAIHQ